MMIFIIFLYYIQYVLCVQLSSNTTSNFRYPNHLGAIMMMVSNWKSDRYGRKCYFNKSMDSLSLNWRPYNNYPIILMDTKPWKYIDMKTIRNNWRNLHFKFINIELVFNSVPNINSSSFKDHSKPLSSIEYKRMCHFYVKGFTQIPLLMEYRYLFRLDDDTCILDPINYDLFQYLHEKNAVYAYSGLFVDPADVVKGA